MAAQVLAYLDNFSIVASVANGGTAAGAASTLSPIVVSLPPLVVVGAGSSPRPMSATVALFKMVCVATMAQTVAGVCSGIAGINLRAAGAALSGAYNPFTDPANGLLPYGGLYGNSMLIGLTSMNISLASLGMPTSLGVATSWTSPPISAPGLKHIAWALTSSQTINLSLNRFADRQGIASIGTLTTTATSAAAMVFNNNDGSGYLSFSIGFTNTSGSVATLSSFGLLLQST